MEDCAAAGRELIVLYRPAPLDGVTVEGGLLEPEYRSFVGAYPLCIRYGPVSYTPLHGGKAGPEG